MRLPCSTVNGYEVLPCSNGPIVNSDANFAKLSPLGASKGLRWLCICKFNAFILNGLINAGGRLPMLSSLILATTTLRQGYNIRFTEPMPSEVFQTRRDASPTSASRGACNRQCREAVLTVDV